METDVLVIVFISAFFLLWFVVFTIYNRRLGISVYYWLREGVEQWGDVTEARWLGSAASGAQIVLEEARAPFKRFGVMYRLLPRESLPTWVYAVLRGRKDVLVVRASLRKPPPGEVRVVMRAKGKRQQTTRPGYKGVDSPSGYLIEYRRLNDAGWLNRLEDFLARYRGVVLAMIVQRGKPHVELRLALAPLREEPAAEWIAALSALLS